MTKRKASVALDTGNESNQSTSTQDNNSNSTSATNTTTGTNNRGTTQQNGSSSHGQQRQQIAGKQQHQVVINGGADNSNSSSQQKNKKERADNWSNIEIQVLHRAIETRRDVFYGPPNQATKKNREIAWEQICKEVNNVSTTPRSLSQVMKKFKNEKCRAKRKFTEAEKDGHNNNNTNNNLSSVNNNTSATSNNNTNLSAQNLNGPINNNQQIQSQQQQTHHMTNSEAMSSQPSSINVVKLAPQNVAKTMIDLPSHVQQIQMPNDDMVLIVPQEMDNLLSGVNIVSDGNGHHFQKCSGNSTLNNQQHNHHGQHALQAINTGQGLVNGTMSNGMMARTIPAGSMCSLVYSTSGDICADQHLANSASGPTSISTNHISVNTQNLMHQRVSVDQNQIQQQHQQPPQQQQSQHQHQHQSHQHQQQAQPQQQQQTHQQQQPQHPHQSHLPAQHHSQHLQQNHLTSSTTTIPSTSGGVAVESQLKNLLFNLLLKDGQHTIPMVNNTPLQDYSKQRNDILAIIANSLNKIESHLSKISKASSLLTQNLNIGQADDNNIMGSSVNNQANSLNMNSSEGNNNNLTMSTRVSNSINTQNNTET